MSERVVIPQPQPYRSELSLIVRQLHGVLKAVVELRSKFLPPHLHISVGEAWEELEDDFDEVIEEIEENLEDLEEKFRKAGLSGKQLRFKLDGFNKAYNDWLNSKGRKTLLKILGWANVILGSLILILPKVEPIKEFKEALENGVDEMDSLTELFP